MTQHIVAYTDNFADAVEPSRPRNFASPHRTRRPSHSRRDAGPEDANHRACLVKAFVVSHNSHRSRYLQAWLLLLVHHLATTVGSRGIHLVHDAVYRHRPSGWGSRCRWCLAVRLVGRRLLLRLRGNHLRWRRRRIRGVLFCRFVLVP